jgi:hypothetical protein
MKYLSAEQYIKTLLTEKLSPLLYYHNLSHTLDVVSAAERIANEEGIINADEIALIKTAALFHDSGFVNVYEKHEEEGCSIAKKQLPRFGYNDGQISRICDMIMATKVPHHPKTHYDYIICDADLDYLGRDDFEPVSQRLYQELSARGTVKSENEWNVMQVQFLSWHRYWTKSSSAKRDTKKEEQLIRLKQLTESR